MGYAQETRTYGHNHQDIDPDMMDESRFRELFAEIIVTGSKNGRSPMHIPRDYFTDKAGIPLHPEKPLCSHGRSNGSYHRKPLTVYPPGYKEPCTDCRRWYLKSEHYGECINKYLRESEAAIRANEGLPPLDSLTTVDSESDSPDSLTVTGTESENGGYDEHPKD